MNGLPTLFSIFTGAAFQQSDSVSGPRGWLANTPVTRTTPATSARSSSASGDSFGPMFEKPGDVMAIAATGTTDRIKRMRRR